MEEFKKYNTMDISIIINLLYYFCLRCEKIKGTKGYFYRTLKDITNSETGKPITKRTIYKFLDNLENYGALELINENKGYKINKENLKNFYLSFEELKKSDWISEYFKVLVID